MKKHLIAIMIISMLLTQVSMAGEWFTFDLTITETAETDEVESTAYVEGNLKDESEQELVFTEQVKCIGYIDDDGIQKKNGWFWIDKYHDNTKQCYYFDKNGALAVDTIVDGYEVNDEGQRIKQNSEEDEIELQEFSLAGPGAADPFAYQVFDEEKFSENSSSSAGELFAHVNATTSIAYRVSTYSTAQNVVTQDSSSNKTGSDTNDEDANIKSYGSILSWAEEKGGPMTSEPTASATDKSGTIIADNMSSVITY